MSDTTGIRERIAKAASVEEAKALLEEFRQFDFASAKTTAAVHNTYKRRLKQLATTKEGK
jgi:hypothetical protein